MRYVAVTDAFSCSSFWSLFFFSSFFCRIKSFQFEGTIAGIVNEKEGFRKRCIVACISPFQSSGPLRRGKRITRYSNRFRSGSQLFLVSSCVYCLWRAHWRVVFEGGPFLPVNTKPAFSLKQLCVSLSYLYLKISPFFVFLLAFFHPSRHLEVRRNLRQNWEVRVLIDLKLYCVKMPSLFQLAQMLPPNTLISLGLSSSANVRWQFQDECLRILGDIAHIYVSAAVPEACDMSSHLSVKSMKAISLRWMFTLFTKRLLPSLGRQIIMSCLYVESEISVEDVNSWVNKDGQR